MCCAVFPGSNAFNSKGQLKADKERGLRSSNLTGPTIGVAVGKQASTSEFGGTEFINVSNTHDLAKNAI